MLSKNKIKYIKSLNQKKLRNENNLFIAEGSKIIDEVLVNYNHLIFEIYATKSWVEVNKKKLFQNEIIVVTNEELQAISNLNTPNECLAILTKKEIKSLSNNLQEWVIALDNIQDPGNLGTIIRIADWFGISNIICNTSTVDLYNPKVIQATMGSFLRVNVYNMNLAEFLQKNIITNIYAAVMNGTNYKDEKPAKSGILVIGNEGAGICNEVANIITKKISIMARGKAESLNASVATGILLSHLIK